MLGHTSDPLIGLKAGTLTLSMLGHTPDPLMLTRAYATRTLRTRGGRTHIAGDIKGLMAGRAEQRDRAGRAGPGRARRVGTARRRQRA